MANDNSKQRQKEGRAGFQKYFGDCEEHAYHALETSQPEREHEDSASHFDLFSSLYSFGSADENNRGPFAIPLPPAIPDEHPGFGSVLGAIFIWTLLILLPVGIIFGSESVIFGVVCWGGLVIISLIFLLALAEAATSPKKPKSS